MVVGVKFKDSDKCVYFDSNGIELKKDDYVIVQSDNGTLFGKVFNIYNEENNDDLKNIVRIASKKDYDMYLKNLADAKEALDIAKSSAKNLGLKMQFVDSSFNFDFNTNYIREIENAFPQVSNSLFEYVCLCRDAIVVWRSFWSCR